ncbi:type III secretion system chaperone [Roseimaritima sediminicola]|uniref:type III secretion system chaperone n=1 Tax=Roseimaritima sediminicola TaxID=2662066 RepID=UPI0012985232|nr:type III secretion system chaperone [Roseimaritima sediminicola]
MLPSAPAPLRWVLVTGLLVSLRSMPPVQAGDDLFSTVSIDTPFAGEAEPAPRSSAIPSPPEGSRISGASSLETALRAAGFETKSLDTRVVATEIKRGKWTIPVRVTVFIDEDQLEFSLLLKTLGKNLPETQVPVDKVLELMAANRNFAPAFFAYDASIKRIELRRRTDNRSVTPERLRRWLEELAEIAVEKEPAWNLSHKAKPSGTQKPSPNSDSKTPSGGAVTTGFLRGVWAADRGKNEAIALQFDTSNKFALAIAKGDQTSRSQGTFTLQGQTLQLNGDDGTQLSGTIRRRDAQGFDLQLPGSNQALAFTKAATQSAAGR